MTYHITPVRMAIIKKQRQVLGRMWRNQNPCTLLLRMQNGAVAMENIKDVPQKIKNRATL